MKETEQVEEGLILPDAILSFGKWWGAFDEDHVREFLSAFRSWCDDSNEDGGMKHAIAFSKLLVSNELREKEISVLREGLVKIREADDVTWDDVEKMINDLLNHPTTIKIC